MFKKEATHSVNLESCTSTECPNIVLAQHSYFSNKNFKVFLRSENTPNKEDKVFESISLIITQRDYSYISTLVFLKCCFTVGTVMAIIYIARRVTQFNFTDVGIIQKKVIILLVLLFLFNEPLLFFHALVPYKVISIFNSVVEATFIAMLLHFWSFMIDTISEEDMIRESPVKFY